MTKNRLLDLGDGRTVRISYEELKTRVSDLRHREQEHLLVKYFPEEVALDRQRYVETVNEARWSRYLYLQPDPHLSPYWLTHPNLVARARANPFIAGPPRERYWVSDFTSWLYKLRDPAEDPAALARGRHGERSVQEEKLRIPRQTEASSWKLLNRDPLDGTGEAKRISLLDIGGRPLYGLPDYVFENPSTNTIIILEIKVSDRTLNSDGWPNLRAQLWAYGMIDEYVNRGANIVLVAEVWCNSFNVSRGHGMRLRQTLRWSLTDVDFCARNQELFDIYCQSLELARDV